MKLREPDKPLVSVVTPSYDHARFIEQTLLSVRNQDYREVEHIIVDGGSTDGTLDLLRKYDGAYNMRWSSEPDKGQADAVNKGLAMARGDILGWLNSDDLYYRRDTISTVVDTFSRLPEVDVVYGDAVTIDACNRIRRIRCLPDFDMQRLLRFCYIAQPAVFWRSATTRGLELDVSLTCAMDYEFWLRLAEQSRFLHVNRILACDRNHPARKSLSQRSRAKEESRDLRPRYGQRFGFSYACARVIDKAQAGYLRIEGLGALAKAFVTPEEELAVPLARRNAIVSGLDQLVGKDLHKT